MPKVWIVEGEHPTVAGRVLKVCASRERADAEALELVKLMPKQGRQGAPTADNWAEIMERIQDQYGAAHAYVEISEHAILA